MRCEIPPVRYSLHYTVTQLCVFLSQIFDRTCVTVSAPEETRLVVPEVDLLVGAHGWHRIEQAGGGGSLLGGGAGLAPPFAGDSVLRAEVEAQPEGLHQLRRLRALGKAGLWRGRVHGGARPVWRRGHGEVERHREVAAAARGDLLQLLIRGREVWLGLGVGLG